MKPGTLVRAAREGAPRMRLRAFRDGRAAARLAATRALLESGLLDALDAPGGPEDAVHVTRRAGLTDVDLSRSLLELGAAYGLVGAERCRLEADPEGPALVHDGRVGPWSRGSAGTTSTSTGSCPSSCGAARAGTTWTDTPSSSHACRPRWPRSSGTPSSPRSPSGSPSGSSTSGAGRASTSRPCWNSPPWRPGRRAGDRRAGGGAGLAPSGDVTRWARRGHRRVGARRPRSRRWMPWVGRPTSCSSPTWSTTSRPPSAPRSSATSQRSRPGRRRPGRHTVVEPTPASRHIGLLFLAQRTPMLLPTSEGLVADLRRAGLTVDRPRRVTPGEPVVAVLARRQLTRGAVTTSPAAWPSAAAGSRWSP